MSVNKGFDVNAWVDQRLAEAVKVAVTEANTALMADLDARFGSLEQAVSGVSVDVKQVTDAVAQDISAIQTSVQQVLSLVTSIPEKIMGGLGNLFPHL